MFEKAKPPVIPSSARASDRGAGQSAVSEAIPLRAIEWSELTARFDAARDLRQLLREDMSAKFGSKNHGFADAAARFFRANEEDERRVNPNALEARKTSSGKCQSVKSGRTDNNSSVNEVSAGTIVTPRCEQGDAREKQ